MEAFNKLTPAQTERLALLAEECGEVVQIIGKILRHGYHSCHPNNLNCPNSDLLHKELGDVQAAISIMEEKGDLNYILLSEFKSGKLEGVKQWLHHN